VIAKKKQILFSSDSSLVLIVNRILTQPVNTIQQIVDISESDLMMQKLNRGIYTSEDISGQFTKTSPYLK